MNISGVIPPWNTTSGTMSLENSTPSMTEYKLYDSAMNGTDATVAMLAVLMAVGVVGNIHVLAVFGFQFKKSSTYVTFVLSLAIINFLMCSIEIPFEILDLLYPYGFLNQYLCKIFRTSNAFLWLSSVFILLLIAFDRYKRVCHPFKIQWSIKKARLLILIAVSGATILTLPVIFVFGPHTSEIANGTYAQKCFLDDNVKESVYPLLYLVFLQILTVVSMIILGFSYISIGLTIRKHAKWRKRVLQYKASQPKYTRVTSENFTGSKENFTNDSLKNSGCISVYTIGTKCIKEMSSSRDKEQSDVQINSEAGKPRTEYENHNVGVPESWESKENDVSNDSNTVVSKEFKNHRKFDRMGINTQSKKNMRTKALFLITVVFIVMYTPYLILGVFLAVKKDFRDNMNDVEITLYRLAMRLVYVNDVINCFIYGIFDHRFKTHVYRFYSQLLSFFKQHYVKMK